MSRMRFPPKLRISGDGSCQIGCEAKKRFMVHALQVALVSPTPKPDRPCPIMSAIRPSNRLSRTFTHNPRLLIDSNASLVQTSHSSPSEISPIVCRHLPQSASIVPPVFISNHNLAIFNLWLFSCGLGAILSQFFAASQDILNRGHQCLVAWFRHGSVKSMRSRQPCSEYRYKSTCTHLKN